jgi:diguanylate cyclase (GGDEF)-like protein
MTSINAQDLLFKNATPAEAIDNATLEADRWRFAAEEQWRRHRQTTVQLHQARDALARAEARVKEQELKIRSLENFADTDVLTSLMNRRGFEKFFARECARTGRRNSPGSVLVLIDIDGFSAINDTHGRAAGDACLQKLADELRASVRLIDGIAHLENDGFAVLLTHTNLESSLRRIHELKYRLNNLQLEWQGETLSFTASVGVENIGSAAVISNAVRAAETRLADEQRMRHTAQLTAAQPERAATT